MAKEIIITEVYGSHVEARTTGLFFSETITIPTRTIVAVEGPNFAGRIVIKTMDGGAYTSSYGMLNRAYAFQVRDAIVSTMT